MKKTVLAGLFATLPASALALDAPLQAEPVDVTAAPTRAEAPHEGFRSVSVLSGERLDAVRGAGLGDALAGMPGVQPSGFGPGASRPVIRGLDAGRVKVLDGGMDTQDVSSFSPDHAVTTSSVFAQQIEVLRGPASVLYGGSAIGGAVNVVSGRIPREPLDGVSGEWVSHFDSASRGTLGGVRVEGGQPGFAYGLELSRQRAGDVRVPGRVIVGDPALRGRLPGSHSDTDEGAMGASWFSDAGFVGAAVSRTERNYGIPTQRSDERPVSIDLQRNRYETAGEWRPGGAVERIRFSASHVDYHHAEVDSGGAIGTRFANRASEARVDASLSDLLGWRTVVGVAASQRKVAVTGAEALLPVGGASAEGQGLFALTTRQLGAVRVEFGGRIDHEARDGAGLRSRDFTPVTASAAVGWGLASGYVLSFTASRSQRAPGVEELYSRGAHAATATFDVGDPNLGLETARSIELGLRKTEGVWRWSGAVYQTRFQGYVYGALGALGGVDSAGDLVALGSRGDFTRQDFRAGQATFRGFELESSWRLTDAWTMRTVADRTLASIDGYGPAPRIAPLRLGGGLQWGHGPWRADAQLTWADRAGRLAPQETPTASYTRLDAGVVYRTQVLGQQTQFSLRGVNLLNEDIRLHTSYLKDGYPLAGRSVLLGASIDF